MQHNYPKRNWPQWLIPTLGSTSLTLLIIGTLFWFQAVDALPTSTSRMGAATTAATTTTFPYQGYLTDEDDKPLDGPYAMTFKLYSQPNGGSVLWTEQHSGNNRIQIEDGLFNVHLGGLNAILPNAISSSDQFYLGITIGDGNEMAPRVHWGSLNTVKETSGTYTTDIVIMEGSNLTTTPTSLTLSYHRFGSFVIVALPRFELKLTGDPNLIELDLPFPPKTWDQGGGGVLTFNGGGPEHVVGVIVKDRISYRKPAGGYQSGSFRGGFWYIAR